MFSNSQSNVAYMESPIGREHVLVPGNVIKYVYREGYGSYPSKENKVLCQLSCHLLDGKPLTTPGHSKHPKELSLNKGQLIKGLLIGLLNMRVSEKAMLVISPEYGYGACKSIPNIPSNSRLIFTLELTEILSAEESKPRNNSEATLSIFNHVDRANRYRAFKFYEKA